MEYLNHSALSGDFPFLKAEQEAPVVPAPDREDCGCEHTCPAAEHCLQGWGLANHPLAMVYAPCQHFEGLYDPDTALLRGTLFSELDLPLEVIEGRNRKNAQPLSTGCAHNCHM